MTERLYYTDPALTEFDARVVAATPGAIILDRTAFYPTSGGQIFDTGWLETADAVRFSVKEVSENERTREVLHMVEGDLAALLPGTPIRGVIDAARRRDHMQQHSGQHVLSAAFVRLFNMPTVSFHLGDDYCTIDLDTRALQPKQLAAAAELANEVVMEDRPVAVCFADAEEARARGVRKLPDVSRGKLRLIDIHGFDLTACGGTHVRTTGQIGPILLRKVENVKQGVRVEFICGARALETAQRDYATLTEAAGVFSGHIWQLAELARRSQDEAKAAAKSQQKLLEELAEHHARELVREAPARLKVVRRVIADRDVAFTKLLAQKIAASGGIALLASTAGAPTLVFAQAAGMKSNLGDIMKQVVAQQGGRGGGSKDFAQGGIADAASAEEALQQAERLLHEAISESPSSRTS